MVKGQRTKGNTKPSSSHRTAELLGSEAVNSFIGFSALSSNTTEDEDIDSDFKVVFKKMSKKDSITKVKALQEFQRLVNEKPETSVKAILIQWPRLYNKLAIDNDWRVREATHKSQEQLVSKTGKNITPHLKQMMPIWLTSQYDPYTPAATAATASFDRIFPSTKKLNALVFTKSAVLNYIKDMVLNQTIESVSEETATPEENKCKYNRLVSNSLQGLSALIANLPSDSLAECQTTIEELVNTNKFWKFAKFPDSSIRSSWFGVMSTLAQHLPQLFTSNASKICGLTLGGLDEKDHLVAVSVWECALLCVITIDECWKFVNFRKAFYPQLRNILREGGRGNASKIFPNLLPLLSRIPHESTDSFIEFNKEFFAFLREGLQKTVSKSQSESNAIIKAYMECLRFAISNHFIEDNEKQKQFQSYLIQNELLSLVNESISTNDCLSKSSFFSDLAVLWLYLRKEDKYQELIRQIRFKMAEICLKTIKENDLKSFPRISRLFFSLFSDSTVQKKIRFRRDSDEDNYKSAQNIKLNDLVSDGMAVSALNQISEALIECYHSDNTKRHYLELLVDLFRLYTKDSFGRLLKVLGITFDKFWSSYLNEWFAKCIKNEKTFEKTQQIKALIDLTLILMTFVEEVQQKHLFLDQILTFNDPIVSELLFSKLISSNDKYLSDWLMSETTGTSIVKMTSQLMDTITDSSDVSTKDDSEILLKLINHCFADNSFNKLYVEIIIQKLSECLRKICRSQKRDQWLGFTCALASQLFANDMYTSLSPTRELLLDMFSNSCQSEDKEKHLSNAWRTGITNIIKSNGCYLNEEGILFKLILSLKSQLNSNITSLENAQLVFRCGHELIDTVYQTINSYESTDETKKPILSDPNIELMLNSLLLSSSEWNQLMTKCDNSVLHYDWLNRDILFDANNCQMVDSNGFDTNGIPFVFSAVSTVRLLETLFESHSTNELSSDLIEVIKEQLKYIFTAGAYLSIKSKSEQSKRLSPILTLLEKSLNNLLEMTKSYSIVKQMVELLLQLSINGSGIWTQTLAYFTNDKFMDNFDEIPYQLSFDNLTYNKIITFQELSPHLSQNVLNEYLVQSMNSFVCCERFVQLDDGIAKLAVLHSCLKYMNKDSENIGEPVTTIMETLCGLKSSNSDMFYHNNDIESNDELQFYCLICQVFDVIVDKFGDKLSQNHWDLIFISTTHWVQNVIRQKDRLENDLSINIFVTKVFKLLSNVAKMFDNLALTESKEKYWEQLFIEWQDFHSKHLFDYLIAFYFHFSEKEMNFYDEILFKYISKVVVLVPYPLIIELLKNQLQKESLPLQPIDKEYNVLYLPPEKETVFNMFSPLLLKNHLPLALSSHQLIHRLIPFLMKDVTQPEVSALNEEDDDDLYLSPPKSLLSILQNTDLVVDTMLAEYSIDCCCIVEPQTDAFTYTFAYLLLWVEILELMANIREENPILRSQMISFLKVNSYLSRLLKNLFRLMPLSTTNRKLFNEELFDKLYTRHSLFEKEETIDSSHIQKLAFHLYYLILRQLPAALREWFKSSDRKTSDIVNEITTKHFSLDVAAHEVRGISKRIESHTTKHTTMEVKVRPNTREVVVNYSFEEMYFELSIVFPVNYPLDIIKTECINRIGIRNDIWKKWMLQLMKYLNYLDGSLVDALTIFKKNIDKHFDGVDECVICYFVLHTKNFTLPEKVCSQCKKCFHSTCLHKWFSTSNNTLCPACRQLWNFYGNR